MGQTDIKLQRVEYFDALRVFASLAVMVLHLAAQHWADTDVHGAAWGAFNAWNAAVRWCVPVFVMISGALFLERPVSLNKLYGRHVLRIAVAFVFWSGLYAYVSARRSPLERWQVVYELVRGHYHLWFLYMIAGLYLLVPLLQALVASERLGRYFLLLALLFGFALPELTALTAQFTVHLGADLQTALQTVDLRFVMGFSGYFVLGCALNRRTLRPREELAIYALGLLGFAVTLWGTQALSLRANAANGLLYGYCTVNVLAEAVAVFTLFKQRLNRGSRLLRALSGASFGAYLVHALVIDTLQLRFGIDTLSLPPLLSVPLLAAFTFVCAYAAALLLRKLPLVREYLV
ncbi:MAG: acyltransferase family protein [Oscillospiraceae bacterium]|nr:acyltransferase family protein [Oscillospiraceae bacterium]